MKKRVLVPELMDDPNLCPQEHAKALRGLRRINAFSGTVDQLVQEIVSVAKSDSRFESDKPIRILDLGCANGEIAMGVAQRLVGRISAEVIGWDMSCTAIEHARELQQKSAEYRGCSVRFEVMNVFDAVQSISAHSSIESRSLNGMDSSLSQSDRNREDVIVHDEDLSFDIVYCTLFLHHFDDASAVEVLGAMKRLARRAVIVDDLCRTSLGWWLAYLGCHLLSRSRVVHFDGPQSVRAALTPHEAQALAAEAGMRDAAIRRHWPERFMMRWERAS
jgi:2-polyprenyl-3-methyl-5-hydroxy-6-metoxy-1,4-benzoquinol methylase